MSSRTDRPALDDAALAAAVLRRFPEAIGVWLYGSFAEGRARPDSDIDLALLAERRLDPARLFEARLELGGDLGRAVDLVDLRRVSALLRFEVVGTGRLIYARDADTCARFATLAVSMYQQHYREQRARFEDIRARGRVF
jgi:predicted nucleotidyltransferase